MRDDPITRRSVLGASGAIGLAATGAAGLAAAGAARAAGVPPIDTGTVAGGKVAFPPIDTIAEAEPAPPPASDPQDKRVGFAVVGLGRLAVEQIIPAFARSRYAKLVALVSGTPDKLHAVAAQHGIAADACYSYTDFARIKDNRAVEAVYVVTPNGLHRRDVLAAAAAGKHVLCEKPMAVSAAECRDMIATCARADVKLMIAYRMQYQPHFREAVKLARSGALGDVTMLDMVNNQNQGDPAQWRLKRTLAGGGSLPDVGLYCLNAARSVLGEEPVAVSATIWSPADGRFTEVESNVAFTLRFPSGAIANCMSSYDNHRLQRLKLIGSTAWLEMDDAFAYAGQRLKVAQLVDGREQLADRTIPAQDQFALELDHFATCVRSGTTPRTPGEEGLQDHVVMAAIYAAAKSGRWERLPPVHGRDAFRGPEPITD